MSSAIALLRARVTLERPTRAPEDLGETTRAYAAVGDVWARLEPMGVEDAQGSWRIGIRMRRDVRPGWRVAHDDRRFFVRACVDADETADRLHLYCLEEIP